MKPPNHLIAAWQEHLLLKAQAQVAKAKADILFRHAAQDVVLRVRADSYSRMANRLRTRADVLFRQALVAEFSLRTVRFEWKDDHICTVWVRKPYTQDEHPLNFHRSLRQSRK